MKNIHILPTEKGTGSLAKSPKTTFYITNNYNRGISDHIDYNICITNDEVIKDGDWYLDTFNTQRIKANEFLDHKHYGNACKKIILTTDSQLIADGVQYINDEFLEWFVKNPSCEEIEVKLTLNIIFGYQYKIIIPKEEPTCWDCKGAISKEGICFCNREGEEPKQENCCTPIGQIKRYVDCKGCDRKPNQEIIEEAALRLFPKFISDPYNPSEDLNKEERNIWINGAKWQQERSYSEEEIFDLMNEYADDVMSGCNLRAKSWFEQFKKK